MRNLFMHSENGGSSFARQKSVEAANGKVLIIKLDCFCGIGGVTDAAKRVVIDDNPAIKVIVAINHSESAIEIHEANNPDVEHFIEDIRLVSMMKLKSIIQFWQSIYPNALLSIWFSAECTNLSNAKGGMSRNPDSRTLSNDIFRYIQALDPDYIFIENVREIMAWGPVRIRVKAKHKEDLSNGIYANSELKTFINRDTGLEEYHYEPWSKKNGLYFQAWKDGIIACGYNYGYKILDSADYGAYQSRERYFAIFAKPGLPIDFPKPTHERNPSISDLFSEPLKKWKPVKDVLDLDDHGYSIFYKNENMSIPARNRKKTCEKSLERYYDGVLKHICGGENELEKRKQFLRVYHGSGNNNYSLERPATTIPTNDSIALITCEFYLDKQYKGITNHQSVKRPAGALTTVDKHRVVSVERLIYNPGWFGHVMAVERPSPVIVARQDKAPISILSVIIGENVRIPIYSDDSPALIKLKELMALFDIVDIKMRMLKIPELLAIMGFNKDMILKGSQEEIKKGIGNAVEGVIGTAILQHIVNCLDNQLKEVV